MLCVLAGKSLPLGAMCLCFSALSIVWYTSLIL